MLGFVMRSDPEYLIDHGDRETEQDGSQDRRPSYFLESTDHGEPPGLWWGPGADGLGLAGTVQPAVMRKLYGSLEHPETGEPLGTKLRNYATTEERLATLLAREVDPTPERIAELRLEAAKSTSEARTYADLTFSPTKSWSVLHAALESAGRHEEAEAVWAAWMTGVKAGLGYLMDEAGYSRAGYHGRSVAGRSSGKWLDAHEWVVSLWRHHTSRDGDPQLHVHAAVLNRVLCSDGVWRSLDSAAIKRARPAAGAVAERVAEEALTARLGVDFIDRLDGKGREIRGVSQDILDLFSSRRRAIKAGVAELVDEYTARYGRAPSAYTLRLMSENVTLKTRARKPDHSPTAEERLNRWEETMRERLGTELAAVVEAAKVGQEISTEAVAVDRERVVALAIAEIEQTKAVWNRYDLVAALNRHLGASTRGWEPERVEAFLNELADQATAPGQGIDCLTPPAVVDVPDELRRADGRSVYEPHRAENYATSRQLSDELQLLDRGMQVGARRLSRAEVKAITARSTLTLDQASAVEGILTSGRKVDVLVGPPGTGKSFTVASLTDIWESKLQGRGFGIAVSQNAVQVLQREGLERGANVMLFLLQQERIASGEATAAEREKYQLTSADLVIVDEGSMVATEDLRRIVDYAAAAGAKVVVTGDPEQLDAVGPSGAMRLLVHDVGAYQLDEVRRFKAEWEKAASLRLRDGEAAALLDYDRRGRVHGGSPEAMKDAALQAYLADLLGGRDALLVTATTEEAAELSSTIRSTLVELGKVSPDGVTLRDGTTAGVGDLIEARKNRYDLRTPDGDSVPVVNREVYRVVGVGKQTGGLWVRQQLERDGDVQQWGEPRQLPADYVKSEVELGYASTTHAAQGRTVDFCHALFTKATDRAHALVALTRGREQNHGYVATPEGDEAQRLAVLGSYLERPSTAPAATEVLRDELDATNHLGRLGPVWSDVVNDHERSVRRTTLAVEFSPELASKVCDSPESSALFRLLNHAGEQGYDKDEVLRTAIASRELDSAESVAKVLHHRISLRLVSDADEGRAPAPTQQPVTFAERTPDVATSTGAYARQLAEVMDRRAQALGEQVAEQQPQWTGRLGQAPTGDVFARAAWVEKAAVVAAYREQFGWQADADPIGPAPKAGQVEARAAWERAASALGLQREQREFARKTSGELDLLIERHDRQKEWAPPNVDEQLRSAHLRRDQWTRQEARHRARADAPDINAEERAKAARAAEGARKMADSAQRAVDSYESIATARSAWRDHTDDARRLAETALRERQHRERLAGNDRETERAVEPQQSPAPVVDQPAPTVEQDATRPDLSTTAAEDRRRQEDQQRAAARAAEQARAAALQADLDRARAAMERISVEQQERADRDRLEAERRDAAEREMTVDQQPEHYISTDPE